MTFGDQKSSNIPPIPAPPSGAEIARNETISGISPHRLKRIQDLLDAGKEPGAISKMLSLPTSIIVMVRDRPLDIRAIRHGPLTLGNEPGLIEPSPSRTHR